MKLTMYEYNFLKNKSEVKIKNPDSKKKFLSKNEVTIYV